MDENDTRKETRNPADPAVPSVPVKRAWQEPRLKFVEPKLTKQGDLVQLTAQGFFGTFVP